MIKKLELSDPQIQDDIKEFVLLMLGAPVIKIELDEKQLNLCVKRTCEILEASPKLMKWSNGIKLMLAKDGALIHAKLILGRVRSKFGFFGIKEVNKPKSKSSPNTCVPLDGAQLLVEGERQYQAWQLMVVGEDLK